MEAVPVQLETATPTTTGLAAFCEKTQVGRFAQALENALGKAMGASQPDVGAMFPESSEEQKAPALNGLTIPNLPVPILADFPQTTVVATPEDAIPEEGASLAPDASGAIPADGTGPAVLVPPSMPFGAEPVPFQKARPTPIGLQQVPTPVEAGEPSATEAAVIQGTEALPSPGTEETEKPETKVESDDTKAALRPATKSKPDKTNADPADTKPNATEPVSAGQQAAASFVAPLAVTDQTSAPSAAKVPENTASHAISEVPNVSNEPTLAAPREQSAPLATKQPTVAAETQSSANKRAVTAKTSTSEVGIETSNLPERPRAAESGNEARQVGPKPKDQLRPETMAAVNAAPNPVANPPHRTPAPPVADSVPSDVVIRVEGETGEKPQESVSTGEVRSADSRERTEPKRDDATVAVQAIPTARPTVVQCESAPPSSSSQSASPTQTMSAPVEARQAPMESTVSHGRSETSVVAEPPRRVEVPDAPVAARMIDRLGHAELHLGMRTEAFGSVQVHTVIRDSQVGLAVGGERGDLRLFLAPEVAGLENNLRQHDLRFNGIQFLGGDPGGGAGHGNSGSYSQQFHAARSFQHSPMLGERDIEENVPIQAAITSGLSVHA